MTNRIHWTGAKDARVLSAWGDPLADDPAEVTCIICREEMNPPPAAVYVMDDHALSDVEFMVTVWPDGTAELASRPNGWATWGPPTLMERREVDTDGTLTEDTSPEESPDQAQGTTARSRQGSVRPE